MLVLEYGIECDLMKDGNIRVVDGEIEITSEEFLSEMEGRLDLEINRVGLSVHYDLGGMCVIVTSVTFEEDEYLCLDVELTLNEMKVFE